MSGPQYHSPDLLNVCLQKIVYMLVSRLVGGFLPLNYLVCQSYACAQQPVSNQTRSLSSTFWPFPEFSLQTRLSQFDAFLPCSQVSMKVDQTCTHLFFFFPREALLHCTSRNTCHMSTIWCAGHIGFKAVFCQTTVMMTTSFLKLSLAPDILPIVNS